jgi:two-component system response regulator GlrR
MLEAMSLAESPRVPQTRSAPVQPRVKLECFVVRVVRGTEEDQGREVSSCTEPVAIGASPGNRLVLADGLVSRHHCEITTTPLGLYVRDLGSTNGTFVDGVRVDAAYLRPGARLGVGGTTLVVEVAAEQLIETVPATEQFGRLLGTSALMRRVFAVLERVAHSESTVLLEGETGTGKTSIAQMMHERSDRAGGPFVVVDCSAIPPTLIESELFGHEKGAFTGAHAARAGAFEAARGGTVFLDEIGELPLDMQPKLLRALEERVIKRVGSTDATRLDVRLVAATNRDLRQEVNRGAFRADLYYRLNTVRVKVPALRERPEDIPLLVASFFRQFAGDDAAPSAALLSELMRRPWPGNVRELRSAVERAVLLGDCADGEGDEMLLEPASDFSRSFRDAKEEAIARFERRYLRDLLAAHNGNLSRAARAVRMDRNHLRDLAKRHSIPIK